MQIPSPRPLIHASHELELGRYRQYPTLAERVAKMKLVPGDLSDNIDTNTDNILQSLHPTNSG